MLKPISILSILLVIFNNSISSQSSIICFKANSFAMQRNAETKISDYRSSSSVFLINVPKMQIHIINEQIEEFTILSNTYSVNAKNVETFQYVINNREGTKFYLSYVRGKNSPLPSSIIQSVLGDPFTVIFNGNEIKNK